MDKLNEYYTEARELAKEFIHSGIAIDKIHTLVGHEQSVKFRFADGICNLKLFREILEKSNTQKVSTGFKYSDKAGVIKQRTNKPRLVEIIVMNYDMKLMERKLKVSDLITNPRIIEILPDIGNRKDLIEKVLKSRMTGVLHYDHYKTIIECVKELQ